jgi:hypothetical protein
MKVGYPRAASLSGSVFGFCLTKRLLAKLAIAGKVGSLLVSNATVAQILPPQ